MTRMEDASVVELIAKSAFDGLELPFEAGGVTLNAVELDEMVSVSPYQGVDVSPALKKAVGLELSDVGRFAVKGKTRVIWSGRDQWFVAGPVGLAGKLSGLQAGITAQADGWAVVQVMGAGAADVLCRLCPLDFEAMAPGDVARSEFQHMQSVILSLDKGFEIMVFRSMARTLVHDLKGAMTSVAAQQGG